MTQNLAEAACTLYSNINSLPWARVEEDVWAGQDWVARGEGLAFVRNKYSAEESRFKLPWQMRHLGRTSREKRPS